MYNSIKSIIRGINKFRSVTFPLQKYPKTANKKVKKAFDSVKPPSLEPKKNK